MKLKTENSLLPLLSALFLWAGGSKILAPDEFAAAVAGYRLTGPTLTLAVAAVLPWVEVLCAAGLWLPRWRRAAGLCLIVCCLAFAIAIAQAWVRELDIECGCFGGGERNAYLFWLLRDAIIFGALARLGWGDRRATTPERAGDWHGLLYRTGALVGCGAVVGLGGDALRPSDGFWSDLFGADTPAYVAASVSERTHHSLTLAATNNFNLDPALKEDTKSNMPPHEVDLPTVRQWIDSNAIVLIDARSRVFWRLGHLPGALSLPHDDFARALPDFLSRLRSADSRPIVVYCEDSHCLDGENVARRLGAVLSPMTIQIFRGGWKEWEEFDLSTPDD